MKTRVYLSILALSVLAAACGGGGGGTGASITPNAPSGVAPQAGKATLSITIPAAPAGQAQSRKYISSGTESVVIMQGTTNLGTFNTTPASPGCGQTQAGLTCTFSIAPTVGANQIFTVTAYQFQNAGGAVLSSGTTTVTVNSNANTNIAISMGGTPASLGFVFPNVPAGTPTSAPFSVVAKDATGSTIVGATAFSTPIALNVAANGGVVALSVNGGTSGSSITLNSPSDVPSIAYNGHNLGFASISATSGALSTSAYFGPTPTMVAQNVGALPAGFNLYGGRGVGPDSVTGSFWYTAINTSNGQWALLQVSPTATVNSLQSGQFSNAYSAQTVGGKLWLGFNQAPITLQAYDIASDTFAPQITDSTPAYSQCTDQNMAPGGTGYLFVGAYCYGNINGWAIFFADEATGTASMAQLGNSDPFIPIVGSNAYSNNTSSLVLEQQPIQGTPPNYSFGNAAFATFSQPTVGGQLVGASDGSIWNGFSCTFAHVIPASPFTSSTGALFTIPTSLCDPTAVNREAARGRKTASGGGLQGPPLIAPDGSIWGFGQNGYFAGMPSGATSANVAYSIGNFPIVTAGGTTVPFSPSYYGFAADGNIIVYGEVCCNNPATIFTVEIAY